MIIENNTKHTIINFMSNNDLPYFVLFCLGVFWGFFCCLFVVVAFFFTLAGK